MKIQKDNGTADFFYYFIYQTGFTKPAGTDNDKMIGYNDILIEEEDKNNIIDNKISIIRKLDKMAREERVVNRPNTIFILALKEYLLMNDFDPREFSKFLMKNMNISFTTYSIIASRLGIRTKLLYEKFIKDCYTNKKES